MEQDRHELIYNQSTSMRCARKAHKKPHDNVNCCRLLEWMRTVHLYLVSIICSHQPHTYCSVTLPLCTQTVSII